MKSSESKNKRPRSIQNAPLERAPVNELGVVVLFAMLAPKLQLRIAEIRAAFPDCIAYQRAGKTENRVRIEFEYRSSNFRTHRHAANDCDCIVCWEHDWRACPDHLKIIELRQFFDHGLQVWLNVSSPIPKTCDSAITWLSAHNPMRRGDVVVVYEASPLQHIRFLYRVTGKIVENSSRPRPEQIWRWNENPQDMVYQLRRIAVLAKPLRAEELSERSRKSIRVGPHPLLKGIDLFKGMWNRNITEHWWRLHELIVRRNPEAKATLRVYSPESV